MTAGVPFLDLKLQSVELADEVLQRWQHQLSDAQFIGGVDVDEFERSYADYIGVSHAIGVANGTDAVELALRAAGVSVGDEVIIPVNTFIATAEAVSRIGAVPVFVDVDDDFLLIDPAAVEAAVTPRTRAIVPVHLYGQTAPIELLLPIADRHGIPIIEDAAQAQGASGPSGRAGAIGLVSATSFYPGKNLGAAGDAGAVTTESDSIAEFVRTTAAHGSSKKYVHDRIGFNSRLDSVQAAFLNAKLRRLDDWNRRRGEVAARYAELLSEVPGVRTPRSRIGNNDVWHLYVVRLHSRDAIADRLQQDGIGTGIHYPTPLHLTRAYSQLGYKSGQFPVAEAAGEEMLSLPMFPHLTADQQERVVSALGRAVGH